MKLKFSKYQGTGNDFILIDNRDGSIQMTRAEIARLCNRRFGIGADGLILLQSSSTHDFEMKNYNSDGGECSMCGNGGRSLIRFAHDLGIKKDHYRFIAIDGEHEACVRGDQIELKMSPVKTLQQTPVGFALDTGSPHLIVKTKDLLSFEVVKEGRKLRNLSLFMPGGINVNFVESNSINQIFIRTYERGVEDETLSCGTGAIAAALIHSVENKVPLAEPQTTFVQCQGGPLSIRFTRVSEQEFQDIWLIGDAVKTFEGQL